MYIYIYIYIYIHIYIYIYIYIYTHRSLNPKFSQGRFAPGWAQPARAPDLGVLTKNHISEAFRIDFVNISMLLRSKTKPPFSPDPPPGEGGDFPGGAPSGWAYSGCCRNGGRYGWKPSSSSNFLDSSFSSSKFAIRAFRACPLVEIRQIASRRAIRGNSISANATLPPS